MINGTVISNFGQDVLVLQHSPQGWERGAHGLTHMLPAAIRVTVHMSVTLSPLDQASVWDVICTQFLAQAENRALVISLIWVWHV